MKIAVGTKREFFKQVPMRKFDEIICTREIYILPTRRKHDSGYACMEFIAEKPNGELVKIGGYADEAVFENRWKFTIDCLYPSRIIRLFSCDYVFIDRFVGSYIIIYDEASARKWYGNEVVDKLKNDREASRLRSE